nr:ubiquinol-cytochrome-c reductase complex assembly factor 1-like [Procambarus clarkii]
MNKQNKIIHLSSRFRRICNNELKVTHQQSYRTACIYRLGYQNILEKNEPLREFQRMLCFTPKLSKMSVTMATQQPGRLKKMLKKIGWFDYSKYKLKRSGYLLYGNACDRALASDFFRVCDLPDTFYSWFLVTELHIWMLMVRLMAEGEEGRYTRNSLIEALWEDCDARSKKLGSLAQSVRQEQMQSIGSSFQAALFAYDEGLMSDDRVLASALWRRLFSRNCKDPETLECCVQFVRKQVEYLIKLSY